MSQLNCRILKNQLIRKMNEKKWKQIVFFLWWPADLKPPCFFSINFYTWIVVRLDTWTALKLCMQNMCGGGVFGWWWTADENWRLRETSTIAVWEIFKIAWLFYFFPDNHQEMHKVEDRLILISSSWSYFSFQYICCWLATIDTKYNQ